MHFERAGCDPLAVFVVTAVLGDFADVDFGVEVGGEGFAMVAGVAVHDVEVVHLAEVVLGGVGGEYARHAGVEAAAEDGGEAGLFEAFAVGPLPGVFEVGHVAGLVVGGVEVVDATFEACVHDGEVLIGECDVDYQVGVVAAEESHHFFHVVGVDAVGGDVGRADGSSQGVAFGLIARGQHDFGEHLGVLSTFVGHDGAYTAYADNDDFSHF